MSTVFPGQFGLLSDYLQRSGDAQTYFLTTPGHCRANAHRYDNLIPLYSDGNVAQPQSYYYSDKIERSARIGRGVLKALQTLQSNQPIDVVVAHSLWGAPHFLYDEIDAAIVSYIEFPSYRAHGWDSRYPPDQAQRMADKNREMLHFHQVLRSDLTIVPSQYAKGMFPVELQDRIEVQFEGFEIPEMDVPAAGGDDQFTIGFAARDLSVPKGIDTYVRLVNDLAKHAFPSRFVAVGDPDPTVTYGYERQWVERKFKGQVANYVEYLLREYPEAANTVEFAGRLDYAEYVSVLSSIDLFLYPVRYGVGNWGLMEILVRGGCIIALDDGFAAEIIQDGVNGRLVAEADDAWLAAIHELREDPDQRARYSAAAAKTGRKFHISAVAPRYMRLFRQAMATHRSKGAV